MADKQFKTQALGELTPEVLLAQASELKWSGVAVLGLLDESHVPEEKRGQGLRICVIKHANLGFADLAMLEKRLGMYVAENFYATMEMGPIQEGDGGVPPQ